MEQGSTIDGTTYHLLLDELFYWTVPGNGRMKWPVFAFFIYSLVVGI